PSESYDEERRRYGAHCEADTWAADPLKGYEKFLLPSSLKNAPEYAAQDAASVSGYHDEERNVTFYDVKSESLFDFKPGDQIRGGIAFEDEHDTDDAHQDTFLEKILHRLIEKERPDRVYVVVIGVYTDIKIKLLLTGLAGNYDIQNLITSDILTAAPSLERHLAGLDFADKVLDVEIIHSLNDLAQVLNSGRNRRDIPQDITENSVNFRNYRTYFLDKQNLLGYQEQKLLQYLELTKRRATRVYKIILRANVVLMILGTSFLGLALAASIMALIEPDRINDDYLLGTGLLGGIGIAQIIAVFFSSPIRQLQGNLNNLVQLQATLESHSLILALMRHHFSRPERLYSQGNTEREADELVNLREQINMIIAASKAATEQFSRIGQSNEDNAAGEDTAN
ncbi:MAG TPA: hypothetical protein VJZ27_16715, partial [Aggregatilineales bacterium]|nr:hypothetical protein [Aggregatilineales bacterium]